MKYEAFRVDHGVYDSEKHIIDYTKYQVLGQRETDLNWSQLFVADTEEECKAFAFAEQKKSTDLVFVYNPSGFSYTV